MYEVKKKYKIPSYYRRLVVSSKIHRDCRAKKKYVHVREGERSKEKKRVKERKSFDEKVQSESCWCVYIYRRGVINFVSCDVKKKARGLDRNFTKKGGESEREKPISNEKKLIFMDIYLLYVRVFLSFKVYFCRFFFW